MKFFLFLIAGLSVLLPQSVRAGNIELSLPVDASMKEVYVSIQSTDEAQTHTADSRKIDPSYSAIAQATGGQVFVLDPASMLSSAGPQAITQIIAGSAGGENVVTVSRRLEGSGVPLAAALLRPDGSVVKVGDVGVVTNQTNNGQMWSVTTPVAGLWKLQLSGAGVVSISAMAKTPVSLFAARFVERGGRPGHEGLFASKNQNPFKGSRQQVELALSATGLKDVRFIMQDEAGRQIAQLDDIKVRSSDGQEVVVGMNVPNVPYRFVLLANDAQGNAVQRVFPALFQPQ